jgi:GNAT superfamily N-acetyltransferase
MSFGTSANNDYMFNPGTQYFVVKYNNRIIAQSVVVDAYNLEDKSDIIILDNVEVANNYQHLSPLLAQVYQTFWSEYSSLPVKIGTGYNDLIPPGNHLEPNHYKPKHQLGYSDAKGERIYDLPKIVGVEPIDQMITFANLSDRDAKIVAKMEQEAFPPTLVHGESYIMEILEKQRELEVPGAGSSFIARKAGQPAGYLLILPEESEVNRGEQVAHIYDFAVLPQYQTSGVSRKMLEHVLDTAVVFGMAIEAEARAKTAYALIMNDRIKRIFASRGFYLTSNEKLEKYLGGEDFYFVRFEKKIEENN